MLYFIKLTAQLMMESAAHGTLKVFFHDRVFWKRMATPVDLDLTALPVQEKILADSQFTLVQPSLKEVQAKKWRYATRSRETKAQRYLKEGRRNFAIATGNLIVADIWCERPCSPAHAVQHPDLRLFGLDCREGETYAFDAFIDPAYRGHNLAVPLQRFLQQTLKREGCKKVYGSYYDDNIPAMWMHRVLRFTERPKREISRFFFLVKSEPLILSSQQVKRTTAKR